MTADPIGGVWGYALELSRELRKWNVEVALATMGRRLIEQEKSAASAISNVTVFESDYKLEWMQNPWEDVEAAGAWLLDLESRIEPNLIHLNGYSHGALPWQAPCLIVGHSCVCSWFAAVRGTPAPREWDEYRRRVVAGLRSAQLVTAPSQAMLDDLRIHYREFAAAEVVYNGRAPSEYIPRAKEAFALTVGRLWDEAKNVAILQTVAAKLPWPIYAAGEDEGPDRQHARLAGLVPLAQLDHVALADWLGRAAIFVLPARYEPFGLSVLEAGLSGCALVLGDVASLREIWRDAAIFVSPNDPDQISAALLNLIRDSSLRNLLAQKARSRALTFTPDRMAHGYMNLYREILSSHGRKSSLSLSETRHSELKTTS
jgi:glycosyltransferase involved in cell wall biosynthesis